MGIDADALVIADMRGAAGAGELQYLNAWATRPPFLPALAAVA